MENIWRINSRLESLWFIEESTSTWVPKHVHNIHNKGKRRKRLEKLIVAILIVVFSGSSFSYMYHAEFKVSLGIQFSPLFKITVVLFCVIYWLIFSYMHIICNIYICKYKIHPLKSISQQPQEHIYSSHFHVFSFS